MTRPYALPGRIADGLGMEPSQLWLWVVGVCGLAAACVMLWPARRRDSAQILQRVARDSPLASGAQASQKRQGSRSLTEMRRAALQRLRGDPFQGECPDIGLLLIEVATLLHSGATIPAAWHKGLARHGIPDDTGDTSHDGVPAALRALAAAQEPSWKPTWQPQLRWNPPLGLGRSERLRRSQLTKAATGAIAACCLSAHLGAPLAEVLEKIAAAVAESGRAHASRIVALSAPRATARLLGALPLLGLALGVMVGAEPAAMLADGAWGSILGLAGIALIAAGHVITGRLVRAAQEDERSPDLPLVLDLAGAALESGASIPSLLQALGDALDERKYTIVGTSLLLGASWDEAWESPQDLSWRERQAPLESALRPGWEDGASPALLLGAYATSLRERRKTQEEEAVQRLAVRLVLPLGLCHLPAFVILGIAPVIMSIGSQLLA